MNQAIRKRIADINNGIVPEGYKQTPFGIFPRDWETEKKLIDLGTFSKGKGLPGDKMVGAGLPCVGYGDIYTKYNYYFDKAQNYVDEKTANESQPIKKGTLLFTGTGETADEIGKCICYNGDETIYAGGDIILFDSEEVNPLFLAYQQYQDFSLRKKAMYGQGHSVVHIQKGEIAKLHTAYPKIKSEQSKIAEILMKWDEAIEFQEYYIDLLAKQAEEVLRKLIRYAEGEKKKIKDCVTYHPSTLLIKNLKETENGFPVYGANDIALRIDRYNFDCDAVAIIKYGSGAGRVFYLTGKHSVLGTMAEMRPKTGINIKYIYYTLRGFDFRKYIEISTTPNIYFEDYSETEIIIPSIEKQNSVVKNLKSFEDNILLQKEKLEKLKLQRKAMQQYLLTGIVRVN